MIRVNDDYVIEVDEMNYTVKKDLHKKAVDKNGEEYDMYKTLGYFNNLENALSGIIKNRLVTAYSDGEITLEEAIERLGDIYYEYTSLFKHVSFE